MRPFISAFAHPNPFPARDLATFSYLRRPFGLSLLQGRVASEISSGDELVLAELIFEGFFKGLTAPKLCAILSCFVWNGKAKVRSRLPKSQWTKGMHLGAVRLLEWGLGIAVPNDVSHVHFDRLNYRGPLSTVLAASHDLPIPQPTFFVQSGNKVPPALENEYSLVRATARCACWDRQKK